MTIATLINATDLAFWADRRDTQASLPALIRRLVLATVRPRAIQFRSGEGVQLSGGDGLIVTEVGNPFVPDGASIWEMGVNRDIKGKADADYKTRTSAPGHVDPLQSTFVFVTPRRWAGKNGWAAARSAEGKWQSVRAYDADDLHSWLEIAPTVHLWLSVLLNKNPPEAVDLESFWASWAGITSPTTAPELILAGRKEVVDAVHEWLLGGAESLAIRGESRDEALAVFVAAVLCLPRDDKELFLSRAAIARNSSAWNVLTTSIEPLILVQLFDSRDAIARASRAAHRVVVPLGQADTESPSTLTIPPLSLEEAVKGLVASGILENRLWNGFGARRQRFRASLFRRPGAKAESKRISRCES